VHDPDNGIGSFRAQAIPPGRAVDFPPHVTIVHPRTSSLGQQAWTQLGAARSDVRSTITHVAITAFSGDRWQTVQRLPLAGHIGRTSHQLAAAWSSPSSEQTPNPWRPGAVSRFGEADRMGRDRASWLR
jgi:hypothetical protein